MRLAATPLSQVFDIPQGAAGTRATLRLMSRLVQYAKRDPLQNARNTALELTRDIPGKDYVAEIDALFRYVRDNVRYVSDTHDMEFVQSAEVTLNTMSGDCDDMAVLLASLLQAIGKPTRFIAVAFGRPGEYEHVYTEVLIGRQWVALDPSVPVDMGWQPDGAVGTPMIEHT